MDHLRQMSLLSSRGFLTFSFFLAYTQSSPTTFSRHKNNNTRIFVKWLTIVGQPVNHNSRTMEELQFKSLATRGRNRPADSPLWQTAAAAVCVCVCVYNNMCMSVCVCWYQFSDLSLQVLDAVQLPLAAALGGDAVLAAAPDVVDELQLLWGQLVHLDEDLEVVARQVCDLVHGEGQLHLRGQQGQNRVRTGSEQGQNRVTWSCCSGLTEEPLTSFRASITHRWRLSRVGWKLQKQSQ